MWTNFEALPIFSCNFKDPLCHAVYIKHRLQEGFPVCCMQCECVT